MSSKTTAEIRKDFIDLIGELAKDAGYDPAVVESLRNATNVALTEYAGAVLDNYYRRLHDDAP